MDSSASAVIRELIELGTAIPIINTFAEALKKVFEVIEQASRNEDAIVRLHDHALDISEGLLPHLSSISSTSPGFDNALNKLIDLLKEISTYIDSQKPVVTKAISATVTNLVTHVDIYIKNLTDRKDRLLDLIAIDTNRKVTDIAEAKRNSKDDFFHSASFESGDVTRDNDSIKTKLTEVDDIDVVVADNMSIQ